MKQSPNLWLHVKKSTRNVTMNRKEKSRKKKNVEKSLKDGAYTKGTYGMGNLCAAFPLLLCSSSLSFLPLLILCGRFVNFKIELFIIRRVVRNLLFSSGCRGSVHRSDKTPSANYINTVCECRSWIVWYLMESNLVFVPGCRGSGHSD